MSVIIFAAPGTTVDNALHLYLLLDLQFMLSKHAYCRVPLCMGAG
jgi:hypothetical protein